MHDPRHAHPIDSYLQGSYEAHVNDHNINKGGVKGVGDAVAAPSTLLAPVA